MIPLEEAKNRRVCRFCELAQEEGPGLPFALDFGREFSHRECLEDYLGSRQDTLKKAGIKKPNGTFIHIGHRPRGAHVVDLADEIVSGLIDGGCEVSQEEYNRIVDLIESRVASFK